jgi:hypothetical protein
MRESNPHKSSFFLNSLYEITPYREWMILAKTRYELQILKNIFRYIQKEWLEWVDKKINNSIKRGIIIHDHFHCRLSILRNGIIHLQEAKYICDVLENAFRQVILTHIYYYRITNEGITKKDKGLDTLLTKYEKRNKTKELPTNLVNSNFITTLVFSKLTEIISKNWISFSKERNIPGFGNYFRSKNNCRDYKIFIKEMKIIKESRNAIAHSNNLFTKEEVQKLFKISNKWLLPLDIELSKKILIYRKQRPGFLQDLNF